MTGKGLHVLKPANEHSLIVLFAFGVFTGFQCFAISRTADGDSGTVCSASLFLARAAGMIQCGLGLRGREVPKASCQRPRLGAGRSGGSVSERGGSCR